MNVRHRISNGQLNAGIPPSPQVNTKLILKTNWALVLTLDHSERDRLKEALPSNKLAREFQDGEPDHPEFESYHFRAIDDYGF